MKSGCGTDFVGTGCSVCFSRAGKIKEKRERKKTSLGPKIGATEIFTVGLCG